jgi:prevent-host-death family protein
MVMLLVMSTHTLADAKAHLSACVACAEGGEPVVITRHGKPVAALIRFEDLARLSTMRDDSPQAGLAGLLGSCGDEAFADTMERIVSERTGPRQVNLE